MSAGRQITLRTKLVLVMLAGIVIPAMTLVGVFAFSMRSTGTTPGQHFRRPSPGRAATGPGTIQRVHRRR